MDFIHLIKHFFSWRSLIDIGLMAAGLYFLYRTLQRLGTWAIAAGILIAMVVYLFASLLDLKGIEWIFGNLSHVAVLALIIIFQPELRKIFERAASVRRSRQMDSGEAFIAILDEALWKLTERRQGAIAVLPGTESIGEWLSGGYSLEAKPSVPLILSIFDPNSPGHDGAIVISKGKINRFGVRLPISQSSRLSNEYGTRHHAAMGLAEKSDALIIVVSEERGKITVFKNSNMYKVNKTDKLAAFVKAHWRESASYGIELPRGAVGWRKGCRLAAGLQSVPTRLCWRGMPWRGWRWCSVFSVFRRRSK